MSASIERESKFDIKARDGKDIFCRLNQATDKPAEKAVILAHGYTGNPNEYIHMSARDFFIDKGCDVYRLAFYSEGESYRNLHETTLKIQGDDLNDVVEYVTNTGNYNKIYLCGHSYGGCTVLFANPKVTAVSLWDSTFYPWADHWEKIVNDLTPINNNQFSSDGDGMRVIVGKDMVDEGKETTLETMIEKAQSLNAPANCISVQYNYEVCREKLYDALKEPKEFHIVDGADHCFVNANTVQDLLAITQNWFERF